MVACLDWYFHAWAHDIRQSEHSLTSLLSLFVFSLSFGGWGDKIKLKLTPLPRIFMHAVRQFSSMVFVFQR